MANSAPKRISILGVPIDCLDMERALAFIQQTIATDGRSTVLAVNPEKVMAARKDAGTMSSLQKAGLLIPDGIGVVWAVKFLAGIKVGRVPGADLMPLICAMAAERGYRVFLYGAAPGVAERASQVLTETYPALQIAGVENGFITAEDMPELLARINESRADVLFVAMGSPRQELWIEKYASQLDVKVYQGVGGTFNVLAGEVSRAPEIFIKSNLEWLYRLLAEPSRIRRQIVLPLFCVLVIGQKVRQIFS